MVENIIAKSQTFPLSHSLRPEFTSHILRLLLEKRLSLFLVGEKGSGKQRLLQDIRDCHLPGVEVILIDLETYKQNETDLIKEFHHQLKQAGEVPETLGQLFENLETNNNDYLFLLGNIDTIQNDSPFLDGLNVINNLDNVSLLCTGTTPPHTLTGSGDNESSGNSQLKLEIVNLPELTRRQILDDLERRLDEYNWLWFKSNYEEKELFLAAIQEHPLPYQRLSFLANRFDNQTKEEKELKFKKRLKRWTKDFDTQHLKGKHYSAIQFKTNSGTRKFEFPFIGSVISLLFSLFKKKG